MSLWKKISLGVLIFIVLLLGTVAFLVGTTTGLHLLFNAANRWVPGLEIGQVTGGGERGRVSSGGQARLPAG